MNHYSQLLRYIKELADADPFIKTITQGDEDEIDLNKSNIFPLLHVFVSGGGFSNGKVVTFNVSLSCLDIRDKNKEISTDKFWDQDNEVDNLNETLAVLNRIWLNMYRDFADNEIIASENPSLIPLREVHTNVLDGWQLDFEVQMPNTTISLC